MGAERERMATVGHPEWGLRDAGPWYAWGPYLAERAWGTVREDYSADGDAWSFFPFEHARSRAYRWNEDGLGGICTLHQELCLAMAFWNGRDAILKERIFGLTNPQGNHGEDAKEYWWFLDATPSHALLRWRYHYPQGAFPYEDLVAENGRRSRTDPEYELLDTGIFDEDRYWAIEATYAKASPTDVLVRLTVENAGPEADTIHVLPTLWFRNTWSRGEHGEEPAIRLDGGEVVAEHPALPTYRLSAAPGPDGAVPTPLFCDNETNEPLLFGAEPTTAYPKDGIGDHVLAGAETVNPAHTGTKAAWWYTIDVPAGETVELRLRLHGDGDGDAETVADVSGSDPEWAGASFDATVAGRRHEADEFYAELTPASASAEEASVLRQACAGTIWSKQYYRYDVRAWLDGDPGEPEPPVERLIGRNCGWRHFDAEDILSMPDTWEYPWFAAWDLAFHTVVLAHLDPAFAKYQLVLLCREWFMHPNGALPAYEWNFDDVNPPVHALAALRVFEIDGAKDYEFLERVFHKLLVNFTWWVNRVDPEGNNVFEGGFLGLDNISAVDRSHLPAGWELEQSDGTAWMALYSVAMLGIALVLSAHDDSYADVTTKFLEHFASICRAATASGLWDDEDGFFYDQLRGPDDERIPIRVRSLVGLIPVLATAAAPPQTAEQQRRVRKRFADFLARRDIDEADLAGLGFVVTREQDDMRMLAMVDPDRLRRVLARVLDEDRMLGPTGIRSISRSHTGERFAVTVDGEEFSVDYEPGESRTQLYGGNSNWRGPVWFPINWLIVNALERYHAFLGDGFTVECPVGSGVLMNLHEVADELRRRLISTFLRGADGKRPVWGESERLQADPRWTESFLFFEYFDGDTGKGLGASHQTGWTALVADLVLQREPAGLSRLGRGS
jgi:hypothetical protein